MPINDQRTKIFGFMSNKCESVLLCGLREDEFYRYTILSKDIYPFVMCTRPDRTVQCSPDDQSISVQMSVILWNRFSWMKSLVAVESIFLHWLNRVLKWFDILIHCAKFDPFEYFSMLIENLIFVEITTVFCNCVCLTSILRRLQHHRDGSNHGSISILIRF